MNSFKKIKKAPKPAILLFGWLMRLQARSLRLNIIDKCKILDRQFPEPGFYTCWHNRLLTLPPLTPKSFRGRMAVVVSLSRDGEYITDILRSLGFHTLRGSSSKGGTKVAKQIIEHAKNGGSMVLTPDGPRGPKYNVKPGFIRLASACGIPIIPMTLNSKQHWTLKGWDQTQIPKPFSKAEFILGEPLHIPSQVSKEETETLVQRVEDALMSISRWDNN